MNLALIIIIVVAIVLAIVGGMNLDPPMSLRRVASA